MKEEGWDVLYGIHLFTHSLVHSLISTTFFHMLCTKVMSQILQVYNHGLKKLGRLDLTSLGGKSLKGLCVVLNTGLVPQNVQLFFAILVLGLLLLIFLWIKKKELIVLQN